MTTTNDRYVLAAVKRCVDHWSQRKRAFPNAEAILSAIEMAYAEGVKAATPPKGHVLDDTGTVRKEITANDYAAAVRAACGACGGTGVGGATSGPGGEPEPYECEYCGRPMLAIHEAAESARQEETRP